ncbi:MAG: STAS domain-containing protein [Sulfuricaulis sp.]
MTPNDFTRRADGGFGISGTVTFQTVPQFLAHTDKWLHDSTGAVTIDMHDITLADSAGLALLVEWLQLARAANRDMAFTNIPEQVRELIRVNGLQQVFDPHS